jgi:hypothetical protein
MIYPDDWRPSAEDYEFVDYFVLNAETNEPEGRGRTHRIAFRHMLERGDPVRLVTEEELERIRAGA